MHGNVACPGLDLNVVVNAQSNVAYRAHLQQGKLWQVWHVGPSERYMQEMYHTSLHRTALLPATSQPLMTTYRELIAARCFTISQGRKGR